MRISVIKAFIFLFPFFFAYNCAAGDFSLFSPSNLSEEIERLNVEIPPALPAPAQNEANSGNETSPAENESPHKHAASFFNNVKGINLPQYAFSRTSGISAMLVSAINNSKKSVEAALYGITLQDVAEALVAAKKRGVKIRILLNERHAFVRPSEQIEYLKKQGINIRTLKGISYYGIMHNKIGIFDSQVLATGSFNWVFTADNANHENIVFTVDKYEVEGYKKYFEWMWDYSRDISEGPYDSTYPYDYFGTPPSITPSLNFNSVCLPVFTFSPHGNVKDVTISGINAAKKEIKAAIFSLYSQNIANALIEAKKRGVKIEIVTDRVQASQSTVIKPLVEAGIKLRWTRGFNKGVMHHKFAVLDGKLIMTGSYNWSNSAEYYNFENVFLSMDRSYAEGFSKEFDFIYSSAHEPTMDELIQNDEEAKCLSLKRNFPPFSTEDPYIEYDF